MPPKQQASKKTVEKAKAKVVEVRETYFAVLINIAVLSWNFQDKTFGLKNKKGAKNQKFIAQVQNQVLNAGKSAREVRSFTAADIPISKKSLIQIAKQQDDKEKRKEEKKQAEAELQTLFKPVITQQVLAAGETICDSSA